MYETFLILKRLERVLIINVCLSSCIVTVYGPTTTDVDYWRIKTNQEINDIIKGQNRIGFIKKQKLNWLGHVERMAEDNIVQKIKRWKPMSKRPIGRPKTRWEGDFWKI